MQTTLQEKSAGDHITVANIYTPPRGSSYYDPEETIQHLSDGAEADLKWMARLLWPANTPALPAGRTGWSTKADPRAQHPGECSRSR